MVHMSHSARPADRDVNLARPSGYYGSSSESLAPGEASRWGEAVGNIEDARVALDTLARAIEDAVYLDEDAYNQVAPVMQYQRASQVQQQRVTELTLELQETNHKLDECRAQKDAADQRITEMAQELENSTVVFKMHYSELLSKEDEIARLKAIIEGLSTNK
ncbi:hypothetical protein ABBQ32_008238 [Trebouxia sp. C0010 RCD-2024]